MSEETTTRRRSRTQTETLVISQVDDGFRVYAPSDPLRQFLVAGTPEECRKRIEDYRAAGLQQPVIFPLDTNLTKAMEALAPR